MTTRVRPPTSWKKQEYEEVRKVFTNTKTPKLQGAKSIPSVRTMKNPKTVSDIYKLKAPPDNNAKGTPSSSSRKKPSQVNMQAYKKALVEKYRVSGGKKTFIKIDHGGEPFVTPIPESKLVSASQSRSKTQGHLKDSKAVLTQMDRKYKKDQKLLGKHTKSVKLKMCDKGESVNMNKSSQMKKLCKSKESLGDISVIKGTKKGSNGASLSRKVNMKKTKVKSVKAKNESVSPPKDVDTFGPETSSMQPQIVIENVLKLEPIDDKIPFYGSTFPNNENVAKPVQKKRETNENAKLDCANVSMKSELRSSNGKVSFKHKKRKITSEIVSRLRSRHTRSLRSQTQASIGKQLKLKYLRVNLKPLSYPAKAQAELRGQTLPKDKVLNKSKSCQVRYKKFFRGEAVSRRTRSSSINTTFPEESTSTVKNPPKVSNPLSPMSPVDCSVTLIPIKEEDLSTWTGFPSLVTPNEQYRNGDRRNKRNKEHTSAKTRDAGRVHKKGHTSPKAKAPGTGRKDDTSHETEITDSTVKAKTSKSVEKCKISKKCIKVKPLKITDSIKTSKIVEKEKTAESCIHEPCDISAKTRESKQTCDNLIASSKDGAVISLGSNSKRLQPSDHSVSSIKQSANNKPKGDSNIKAKVPAAATNRRSCGNIKKRLVAVKSGSSLKKRKVPAIKSDTRSCGSIKKKIVAVKSGSSLKKTKVPAIKSDTRSCGIIKKKHVAVKSGSSIKPKVPMVRSDSNNDTNVSVINSDKAMSVKELIPRLSDKSKLERKLMRRGLVGDSPEPPVPLFDDSEIKQEVVSPPEFVSTFKNRKKISGKVKQRSVSRGQLRGNSWTFKRERGSKHKSISLQNTKRTKPLKRSICSVNNTSSNIENETDVSFKKGRLDIKEEPLSPASSVLSLMDVKKEIDTDQENGIDFNSVMNWSESCREDFMYSSYAHSIRSKDSGLSPKKGQHRKRVVLGERELQTVCTGIQTDDVVILPVKSEPYVPEYEKYLGTSHLTATNCLHEEFGFMDESENCRLQEYIGSLAERISEGHGTSADIATPNEKGSPGGSDKENVSTMSGELGSYANSTSESGRSPVSKPMVRRSSREKKLSGWFKKILSSKTASIPVTVPAAGVTPTSNSMPFIHDVVSLAANEAAKNKVVTQSPKTNVVSSPSTPNQQATAPQRVITKTVKETTTQTKVMVQPIQPKTSKNKSVLCKPFTQTKATSCRPHAQSKEVQTEEDFEKKATLIPVPVPVYVPVPMAMYNIPVPYPVPLPIPIPVPCFIPTTKKSAASIMKQIEKIQSSMPADPFEAELLSMAAAVAGDDRASSSDTEDEESTEPAPVPIQEVEKTQPPEESTDVLQMAFQMASGFTAETVLDMEDNVAPMPVNPGNAPVPQYSPMEPMMTETPRRGRGKRRGGSTGSRQTRSSKKMKIEDEVTPPAPIEVAPQEPPPDENMVLKFTYGVNAWKHWVAQKNQQLERTATRSRRQKMYKADILACTADELNFQLCQFVQEVRKPNGEEYAPDSIYYLCLGIQEYLYENGRIDNIFTDLYYEQFNENLNQVIIKYEVRLNAQGLIVCRIEEEHLWESKQLGAHSPYVLLNTLIYFNTRFFMLRTPEEHLRLSFSHIMKHWKKTNLPVGKQGGRSVYLRYYAPQHQADINQKRKRDDLPIYEQGENIDNPLRCPVKLYEFYLSKCPESIKNRNDVFYLTPERSCVPDSPVWYSTLPLGKDIMARMLNRLQVVKEIQEAHLAYQPGVMM